MKPISVSIIPSFYCKTNCPYCYLNELRQDHTTIAIDNIVDRLQDLVNNGYLITSISLYGGELSLLDQQYLVELFKTCKQYCNAVGVATNGQNKQIFELCDQFDVSVLISLNQERPDYKRSLKLIEQNPNCSVGVVVLPSILNQSSAQFCQVFDQLGRDVYLFQYYQADINSPYKFDNKQYTDWVIDLLQYYHRTGPHNFKIINEVEWTDHNYNPNEDGFIYIMPNGKYATTQYVNNLEQYCYFDSLTQWEHYCSNQQLIRKIQCSTCQYFNQCKAEHLVVYNDQYCSGLQCIIKFYKNTTYNSI